MTTQSLKKFKFIEVSKLSSVCGAEIVCGDLRKIDDLIAAEIREAWLEHLVVVIRNQRLNKEDLVTIGGYFGNFQYSNPLSSPLVTSGKVPSQGGKFTDFPEITVVSNIVEKNVALGGLGDGDVVWHTDMSSFDEPPNQTILYAIEVPSAGGDTYFCNMYEALNTLPKDTYKRIKNLNLKYNINDMIKDDVIFCATGVTDGDLVKGIKELGDFFIAETFVLHESSRCKKISKNKIKK